jgi:hypothetical protein
MVWKEVSLSWREKCVSVELRRIHKNFVTRAYVDTGNCNMIGDKYIMFILWWHIIYIHSITYIYAYIYIEQTCACIYIYMCTYTYTYTYAHIWYIYTVYIIDMLDVEENMSQPPFAHHRPSLQPCRKGMAFPCRAYTACNWPRRTQVISCVGWWSLDSKRRGMGLVMWDTKMVKIIDVLSFLGMVSIFTVAS